MSTEIITPVVSTEHPLDTDEAYQAEMLAKAEAGIGSKVSEKEETLIAGKYKTEDELHKGILELIKKKSDGNLEDYYKALEQEFHRGSSDEDSGEGSLGPGETIPADSEEGKAADDKEGDDKDTKKTPKVGIDFDKYNAEFTTNGVLTDASLAEIEKAGIPKEITEQYVAGLKATAELNKAHAFNLVGGEENYMAMIKWAKTSLHPVEIEGFNAQIQTNDLDKRGGAIASLYKRYSDANPVLIDGDAASTVVDAYKSRAEMSRDMCDPRYQKDPAFREEVMNKLRRSKIM